MLRIKPVAICHGIKQTVSYKTVSRYCLEKSKFHFTFNCYLAFNRHL